MKFFIIVLFAILLPFTSKAGLDSYISVDPYFIVANQGDSVVITFNFTIPNPYSGIIFTDTYSTIPEAALKWRGNSTSPRSRKDTLTIYTKNLNTGYYVTKMVVYYSIDFDCASHIAQGVSKLYVNDGIERLKTLSSTETLHVNSGISKDKNNTIIGLSYDTTKANPYAKTRFEKGQFIRTEIPPYEMTFLHDNRGNFWHNADTGLLRYNGTTTDFFPFPTGVKRKIRSVALDKLGQPVVFTPVSSTFEFGNELYQVSGKELQRIFTVKEDVYYQYDNFDFGTICVDSANNLWTNATARGVFRQDKVANSRYFSRNNADPIGETTLIQCDKKGNVWFAAGPDSTSVLSAFDGKYWWFIPGNRNELKNIIALDFDSEGRIWCGTKGAGLWRYEGVSWKQYSLSNSLLPSNEVTKVLVDNNDNVWAVTPAGIVVFNPNGLKGMTPPASSGEMPDVTPAFEVFPQPADETVTIQWGNPADELILYDAFGRVALRLPLAAETSRTFSVSGLMNGVYFCRVGSIGGQIIISR